MTNKRNFNGLIMQKFNLVWQFQNNFKIFAKVLILFLKIEIGSYLAILKIG